MAFVGPKAVFAMPQLDHPSGSALAFYIVLGGVIGWVATFVTRAVYAVEDGFEKLPIHWMWWPTLGGLVVGAVGYFAPHTMGVGYDNIEHILQGSLTGQALLVLFVLKFVSWSISLGSGTSGGTLAPLFTIGGGLGALLGAIAAPLLPSIGIDPRIAGLVGMAAIFAGASRALLASVVFAFETTLQPLGLLPLLGGCTAAYLVSCFLMRNTIMTEKIARRGIRVPSEYAADLLDQIWVGEVASREVITLGAADRLQEVRSWLESGAAGTQHHGFPVLDDEERLLGVVTRRQISDKDKSDDTPVRDLLRRPPAVAFENSSLREAADLMVKEGVGRLPVVSQGESTRVVAILSRSDLLAVHGRRLHEDDHVHSRLKVSFIRPALRGLKARLPLGAPGHTGQARRH
jgi:CBS domain-containing protein